MTPGDVSPDPLAWIGSDSVTRSATEGEVTLCGACWESKQCRLGVRREWLDGEVSVFELSCPRDQEGGPNVAHGGWTAAAMDEMLGHVPLMHEQMSVTATLTVNFRKPVPVERPLAGRAWIDKIEGSRWFISGELLLLPGRSGLATATGIWVARDYSHFARHAEWLAEQDSGSLDRQTPSGDPAIE
ncbi:PaaI family thioesterase [Mycolicibacterium hodleri]|uniref:Acyl-coenzyme A thioesterase THEM4 n=1 Tax=Mycolicibacterium hodleri TaxID=49897 RepID=A0A502EIZ0_9MYCO|nr:PaaI family thioesterase [Mycolicibacterium hodleri]TPG36466.1 PaaI family thioesterase [Mycolicibacterium hodleri]